MQGQDQSVNLSGMLGQIAETTGSMGDAYKPVMQAATKPRGDMNDPNHLRNLAQWASNNGDSAMATQYMQEARRIGVERKAENEKVVKEAKDRAVNTSEAATPTRYRRRTRKLLGWVATRAEAPSLPSASSKEPSASETRPSTNKVGVIS